MYSFPARSLPGPCVPAGGTLCQKEKKVFYFSAVDNLITFLKLPKAFGMILAKFYKQKIILFTVLLPQ
jgi:hypothetical protein